jgi:hypothetical protein
VAPQFNLVHMISTVEFKPSRINVRSDAPANNLTLRHHVCSRARSHYQATDLTRRRYDRTHHQCGVWSLPDRELLEHPFRDLTRPFNLDLTLPSVRSFSCCAPSSNAPTSAYFSNDQTQPLSVRSLALAYIRSQAKSNAATSPLTGRAGPVSGPASGQLQ